MFLFHGVSILFLGVTGHDEFAIQSGGHQTDQSTIGRNYDTSPDIADFGMILCLNPLRSAIALRGIAMAHATALPPFHFVSLFLQTTQTV